MYMKWNKELDNKLADLCNTPKYRTKGGKVKVRKLVSIMNIRPSVLSSRIWTLRQRGLVTNKPKIRKKRAYKHNHKVRRLPVPYVKTFEAYVVAGCIILAGIIVGLAILFQ